MQNKLLSPIWLNPIIELIYHREYEEAYALAEYFPASPKKQILQCAALVGSNKFSEANTLLKELSVDIKNIIPDFASLFVEKDAILMIKDDDNLYLSYLQLESYIFIYSDLLKELLNNFTILASRALKSGDLNLGIIILNRAIEMDSSPSKLIEYAKVALVNRSPENAQLLLEFAKKNIDQVLKIISDDDIDNRLKIVKLLAVDAQTFGDACNVVRQVLQIDSSAKSKVSDILFPLINYKPYFNEIVDFLLEVNPENFDSLVERLINIFLQTKKLSYLEKSKYLLNEVVHLKKRYSAKLAEALLSIAENLDNFESYVRHYVDSEISSDLSIKIATKLIDKKSINYALITNFLENTIQNDPAQKLTVIHLYNRLSKIAENLKESNLYKEFFTRAMSLSSNLLEFLECGFNNLSDQLITLYKEINMFSNATWYSYDKEKEVVLYLIKKAIPKEKKELFYSLFDNNDYISLERLAFCFRILLQTDLGLTNKEVRQIWIKSKLLNNELRDIIYIC